MTLEEIKALSDRELDARLALAMGYTLYNYNEDRECDDPLKEWAEAASFNDGWSWLGWTQTDKEAWQWKPSASLDAIAPLEAKCVEKFDYLCALWEVTGGLEGSDLITASARHRAEAVLLAWEVQS